MVRISLRVETLEVHPQDVVTRDNVAVKVNAVIYFRVIDSTKAVIEVANFPYPATPLYARLEREGRLTRPRHWLDFTPFHMAHTPLKMSCDEVQAEIKYAWRHSYSPAATRRAIAAMADEPAPYKISHLIARMFFRGIYFPQKSAWGWLRLLAQNRGAIYRVIRESFSNWAGRTGAGTKLNVELGSPSREPDAV